MPRGYNSVTRQTLHYLIRPHQGVPPGPVRAAAAWRGEDLSRTDRWRYTLTEDDIAELETALEVSANVAKPTLDLVAGDFPLPTLGRKIAHWRSAIADGLGLHVVHGLPVQRWSPSEIERAFWCLGQHLGVPGVQNRDGEILGHVRDEGVRYDDPRVRGYKTSARLAYHCDAADAVGLLCLRPARTGGRSRFVSSVTVFNELLVRRPELVPLLFEPFLLDTRGDGGLNFVPIRPCRYAGGVLRTFYHGDYYRSAEQHRGARALRPDQRELLDVYEAIADEPDLCFELDFAPGDIQILSNHTVLHSRTAYTDWDDPSEKRHLLRLWVSFDDRVSVGGIPSRVVEGARLLSSLAWGRIRDRILLR